MRRFLNTGASRASALLEERFEFLGLLAQARRFAHEFLLLEGPLHEGKQFLRRVRFADEMKRAQLDGFDGVAQGES